MAKDEQKKSVFQPDGARKLLESEKEDWSDSERALLLALVSTEADKLDEEERAALDKLKQQVEDYDTEDLAQAVEHMVKAKPREGRKLEWPELKQKLRKKRSSKK